MQTSRISRLSLAVAAGLLLSHATFTANENIAPLQPAKNPSSESDANNSSSQPQNSSSTSKGDIEVKRHILKRWLNTPSVSIPALGLLCCYFRMAMKDEPDTNRLTLDKAIKGLRSSKDRKDSLPEHLWKILDHIIIGYPGKRRGLYAVGHKILIDGDERLAAQIYQDGHQVQLWTRHGVWPYGIMGNFTAYVIEPLLSALDKIEKLRKADETLCWLEKKVDLTAK